jgi:guanylate kinase
VPTKKPAKLSAKDDLPTPSKLAPTKLARRGMLLVLSSPSGAGKTTLAKALLASDPEIRLSVSVTTRKPRPGEVEGKDYYFRDEAGFLGMRDNGELLEWAKVFGNYYGTPRAPVEAAIAGGQDVLFDIDWQGTQQVKEKLPQDLVRVFILPPSSSVLESRLKTRAQDTAEVVAQRMAEASAEISHWQEYDYVIINADLEKSGAGLKSILTAERLKRDRLLGLSDFVRSLQQGL